MKLSEFKLKIPAESIALYPAENRDEARLLVLDAKTGNIEHKMFKEIIEYFDDKDVLVLNNTRVFPARLYGNKERTGARIEVFLLRELNREQYLWDVLVDPARKIRIGNKLYFGENDELVAEVIDNTTSRGRTIRFLCEEDYDTFKKILFSLGETPLPDHILAGRKVEEADQERFQNIFGTEEGSVALPAAGTHFSRELMKRLEIKGVDLAYLTLHMGLGNFSSVEVEDLTKHKMDSERMIITPEVADVVNNAREGRHNVFACGTTVLRAMETSVSMNGFLKPYDGWTNKFIFPPYEFSIANRLISNFHLSQSTMYMMVCAFGGFDIVKRTYETAIKEGYRFGSYGDALLILK
ncbi:MAG: tRNA preQ1(34) S-adenosylmethionine ribosyltransferase-isomerase QueA [Bacteroidales bacterium]|nr:tRNA preQ1(34) S-adenosylmethionine ribosyltransferase-isomerase QueA [Bacteroidales bacterium]MBP5724490.1 tRNA preQ1(34) S-adenosylmethionine ribosyltransferase-isomerase QueA [Bacteroidales bacterium]MBQ3677309.1 tRNA preQ1(34) S-adenosylmethionine ribosyltransferase-isomerase QueA [Bacteroidales bacterium]MBR4498151.1 tRNA preQ1(34) S-adenosylmethionine ribosyltransferase-isomerase QueA [Bacteroidales bacterium]